MKARSEHALGMIFNNEKIGFNLVRALTMTQMGIPSSTLVESQHYAVSSHRPWNDLFHDSDPFAIKESSYFMERAASYLPTT